MSLSTKHIVYALILLVLRSSPAIVAAQDCPEIAPAQEPWPKLICCGSAVDPREMLETPNRLHELPFEGYLLSGNDNRNRPDGDLHISRSVFGPRRLRFEDYTQLIEYTHRMCKIAPKLTENFLQTSMTPGTLADRPDNNEFDTKDKNIEMWFSDKFDIVLHNIRTAARVACAAGMRGLLVDIECYGGQVFNPDHLRATHELNKTYDEIWQQVRLCGERYVRALQEGYPDAVIFMYFTYEPAGWENYRLSPAFVDGIFAASKPGTRIIAAHENYGLRSRLDFLKAYWFVHNGMRQRSSVPEHYSAKVSAGMPVWLGLLHRNYWDPQRPGEKCPPDEWKAALENALATADHYVWVYSEGYHQDDWDNWWDPDVLPQIYIDHTFEALRNTRPTKTSSRMNH